MGKHTNKGLGVELVIGEITQAQLERFQEAARDRLQELQVKTLSELVDARMHGVMVHAALQAGWIDEPAWKPEEIEHMPPNLIRWAAQKVEKEYGEATAIPPE